jgi:hypothetical protein
MKFSNRFYCIILFGLVFFLLGCKKEEDQGGDYIYGVVRNSFTHEPIPFARVGVLMSVSDGLWNSTETVVDTFKTFADGGFRLDRNKYRKLESEGPCSFILCAAGPNIDEGEIFYDNCAVGVGFNAAEGELIYCDLWPKSWVRVKVEDSPELNYNLLRAHIYSPYSWEGIIGSYPENYNSHLGIVVNIPTAEQSEIPVLFIVENEQGEEEGIELHFPVEGIGLDTVNLVIGY